MTPSARAAPRIRVVLPGAQIAADENDVARAELGRQPLAERLGLGGAAGPSGHARTGLMR